MIITSYRFQRDRCSTKTQFDKKPTAREQTMFGGKDALASV